MEQEWAIVDSWPVLQDRKIRFPDRVREIVEEDHPAYGPSVFWNYETSSRFVVLSNAPLQKSNYVYVTRTTVATEKTVKKIRAPKFSTDETVTADIIANFTEGNHMFYLAYEDMIEDAPQTVFLLSQREVLDLLPQEPDPEDDLQTAILETPGFLPSPV